MNFVQTGFLFALLALVLPVLIHLLSRWQVQDVELGTMRFLQEVISEASSRRKIRRWLLLTTRMLLVGLLALLFARPFFSTLADRDSDRLRIILVDHSASMSMPGEGGRLIDDAIAAASDAARRMGQDATVLWATFDNQATQVESALAIDRTPTSMTQATNYDAAISWARDKIIASQSSQSDVVLISDLQQSGFDVRTDRGGIVSTLPAGVPIEVIDVGRPASHNLAIANLTTPRASMPVNGVCTATATLFNHGTFAFEDVEVLATASDGARNRRTKKTVDIPVQQALEVEFDFGQLDRGDWEITVSVNIEDDLYIDNERRVAVVASDAAEILVVDPGTAEKPTQSQSYYLATALEQASTTDTAPFRLNPQVTYLRDDPNLIIGRSTQLVIVSSASQLKKQQIVKLSDYAKSGGAILVFSGDTMRNSVAEQLNLTGLSPGRFGATRRAGMMPFRIVRVSSRGSMLQPFRDPQTGDIGRLGFTSLQSTELDPGTDVLAWFDQQQPAITSHALGKGRVAWFLSAADDSVSDWTTSPLYLPILQQMVGDLLGMTGEGVVRQRTVGDLRNFAKSEAISGGKDVDAIENIYTQPGFEKAANAIYVVNPEQRESDTDATTVEEFIEHFNLTQSETDEGADEDVATESRDETWPWLAALLVVLLVAEFCLANRTPA